MNTNPTTSTHAPTTTDIQKLADAIASDGIAAHRDELAAIAAVAEDTGLFPGAVELIEAASTPDMVRARAFLVLARNWPEIAIAVADSAEQQRAFDRAFRALTCRWERHRKLRRSRSPQIDELWRSRTALEAARVEILMLRSPR